MISSSFSSQVEFKNRLKMSNLRDQHPQYSCENDVVKEEGQRDEKNIISSFKSESKNEEIKVILVKKEDDSLFSEKSSVKRKDKANNLSTNIGKKKKENVSNQPEEKRGVSSRILVTKGKGKEDAKGREEIKHVSSIMTTADKDQINGNIANEEDVDDKSNEINFNDNSSLSKAVKHVNSTIDNNDVNNNNIDENKDINVNNNTNSNNNNNNIVRTRHNPYLHSQNPIYVVGSNNTNDFNDNNTGNNTPTTGSHGASPLTILHDDTTQGASKGHQGDGSGYNSNNVCIRNDLGCGKIFHDYSNNILDSTSNFDEDGGASRHSHNETRFMSLCKSQSGDRSVSPLLYVNNISNGNTDKDDHNCVGNLSDYDEKSDIGAADYDFKDVIVVHYCEGAEDVNNSNNNNNNYNSDSNSFSENYGGLLIGGLSGFPTSASLSGTLNLSSTANGTEGLTVPAVDSNSSINAALPSSPRHTAATSSFCLSTPLNLTLSYIGSAVIAGVPEPDCSSHIGGGFHRSGSSRKRNDNTGNNDNCSEESDKDIINKDTNQDYDIDLKCVENCDYPRQVNTTQEAIKKNDLSTTLVTGDNNNDDINYYDPGRDNNKRVNDSNINLYINENISDKRNDNRNNSPRESPNLTTNPNICDNDIREEFVSRRDESPLNVFYTVKNNENKGYDSGSIIGHNGRKHSFPSRINGGVYQNEVLIDNSIISSNYSIASEKNCNNIDNSFKDIYNGVCERNSSGNDNAINNNNTNQEINNQQITKPVPATSISPSGSRVSSKRTSPGYYTNCPYACKSPVNVSYPVINTVEMKRSVNSSSTSFHPQQLPQSRAQREQSSQSLPHPYLHSTSSTSLSASSSRTPSFSFSPSKIHSTLQGRQKEQPHQVQYNQTQQGAHRQEISEQQPLPYQYNNTAPSFTYSYSPNRGRSEGGVINSYMDDNGNNIHNNVSSVNYNNSFPSRGGKNDAEDHVELKSPKEEDMLGYGYNNNCHGRQPYILPPVIPLLPEFPVFHSQSSYPPNRCCCSSSSSRSGSNSLFCGSLNRKAGSGGRCSVCSRQQQFSDSGCSYSYSNSYIFTGSSLCNELNLSNNNNNNRVGSSNNASGMEGDREIGSVSNSKRYGRMLNNNFQLKFSHNKLNKRCSDSLKKEGGGKNDDDDINSLSPIEIIHPFSFPSSLQTFSTRKKKEKLTCNHKNNNNGKNINFKDNDKGGLRNRRANDMNNIKMSSNSGITEKEDSGDFSTSGVSLSSGVCSGSYNSEGNAKFGSSNVEKKIIYIKKGAFEIPYHLTFTLGVYHDDYSGYLKNDEFSNSNNNNINENNHSAKPSVINGGGKGNGDNSLNNLNMIKNPSSVDSFLTCDVIEDNRNEAIDGNSHNKNKEGGINEKQDGKEDDGPPLMQQQLIKFQILCQKLQKQSPKSSNISRSSTSNAMSTSEEEETERDDNSTRVEPRDESVEKEVNKISIFETGDSNFILDMGGKVSIKYNEGTGAEDEVNGGDAVKELKRLRRLITHRNQQRLKQILHGKHTRAYHVYRCTIPRHMRQLDNPSHPITPRASTVCSKRAFDKYLSVWRKQIHSWDTHCCRCCFWSGDKNVIDNNIGISNKINRGTDVIVGIDNSGSLLSEGFFNDSNKEGFSCGSITNFNHKYANNLNYSCNHELSYSWANDHNGSCSRRSSKALSGDDLLSTHLSISSCFSCNFNHSKRNSLAQEGTIEKEIKEKKGKYIEESTSIDSKITTDSAKEESVDNKTENVFGNKKYLSHKLCANCEKLIVWSDDIHSNIDNEDDDGFVVNNCFSSHNGNNVIERKHDENLYNLGEWSYLLPMDKYPLLWELGLEEINERKYFNFTNNNNVVLDKK